MSWRTDPHRRHRRGLRTGCVPAVRGCVHWLVRRSSPPCSGRRPSALSVGAGARSSRCGDRVLFGVGVVASGGDDRARLFRGCLRAALGLCLRFLLIRATSASTSASRASTASSPALRSATSSTGTPDKDAAPPGSLGADAPRSRALHTLRTYAGHDVDGSRIPPFLCAPMSGRRPVDVAGRPRVRAAR